MQVSDWRNVIGEMVRDHMRSPELEHYFSVKMNKPRAQLMITQLGLYIRHRRDCWALVSANCPVMAIKQAILQHEYGEVIKDQFSDYGHLQLDYSPSGQTGLNAARSDRHPADRQHYGYSLRLGVADAHQELGRGFIGADGHGMDQR
jgi:hypothetical protein